MQPQADNDTSNKQSLETTLQNIQKEYEDFAYIVLHDLNAPLRHIREFTRLLLEARPTEDISQDEQEYAAMLNLALTRLDNMQHGLLSFSRINTADQKFEHINLNHIVQNAKDALEGDIVDANVSFQSDDLPAINGDAKQLYTLFYNLLDNAIKFHKEDSRPKINIKVSEESENYIFEIRDNGIGIAEDLCEDVFRIFRKLHAGDQYAGNGMGLTLAQKIIERHSGKIWIDSHLDKGTSVFFSLPIA